jgi:predicted NUDIX family phosphoesterase
MFQGFLRRDRASSYLNKILDPKNLSWLDRDKAEKDPSFKQLIPYCLLTRGREVFCYQRSPKGGESRLHGLWSIGCGGHVNPVDNKPGMNETYDSAFCREMYEEVGLVLTGPRYKLAPVVGLLYDPSNEVGKVHFGVVHQFDVGWNTPLKATDPALVNGQWLHRVDLVARKGEFESWSQLVINGLFV